jgi:hypothetical protein
MANIGKGKTQQGFSDGLRYLDGLARSSVRVVRDRGDELRKASWRRLEEAWQRSGALAGRVGGQCIEVPGIEANIRVPVVDIASRQLACPKSPSERCGTCIVDQAFNVAAFPMEEAGKLFGRACGKDC